MNVKITNKDGVTLKTKGKFCPEDIHVSVDESLLGGEGAIITTPSGIWSGTPVPNTGYVDKVYFNTALSVEEVVGLLETLTMPSEGEPLILVNIQSVKTIAAFYSSEMNVWAIVDMLNETFYFTTMDIGGGFVGWNPNISYPISINGETTPVNAGIDDLAIELNKISSLFSTTPFTQVGGEQVLLEGDYDGSTLILDELPKGIWSGTPVPTSGYVEKVYINTNLSVEEVVEITRNIPNTYILAASNAADNSNWLKYPFLFITRGNGQFVIMGCESGGSLKGYFNYGGEGDFIGWSPEFNGEFIVDHELYSEHTDTGDTFGVYNEQLSSLFSTTPFVETKANTIDVKALIENKQLPLEIKVKQENTYKLETYNFQQHTNGYWYCLVPDSVLAEKDKVENKNSWKTHIICKVDMSVLGIGTEVVDTLCIPPTEPYIHETSGSPLWLNDTYDIYFTIGKNNITSTDGVTIPEGYSIISLTSVYQKSDTSHTTNMVSCINQAIISTTYNYLRKE